MSNNIVIHTKATHRSLDLFEKPPLLVTFDQSFVQKTETFYSPTSSSLEFEIVSDRSHFIDLQKIYREMSFGVVQRNGDDLRFTTGDANNIDTAHLVNNVLHSFFTDCTVSANVSNILAYRALEKTDKNWYENVADPTGVQTLQSQLDW